MFTLIITAVLFSYGNCERLHNQIYSSIEGGAACFRRLNGTHQAGCSSSSENGAVGTVHWVWGKEDARWVADGGGGAAPYIVLVDTVVFNEIADTLIESFSNVAGVVLYENETRVAQHFSSESHCPNKYSSGPGSQCSSTNSWNPRGSGLLRKDIPFPIFYLPASRFEEVVKILDCYTRFNTLEQDKQSNRPLCSVQLSSFMFAAVNTEVCMRRSGSSQLSGTKQCDPLGDRNIYSSLFKRSADVKEANRSVILVTARIDSASLFDGISPGAAGSAVGVVTLLTAASTLSAMLPAEHASSYSSNVIWALLSGETFDYIGSQRIAYDMLHNAWPPEAPLSPASVALHVELGQLGGSLGGTGNSWGLTAFAPHYQSSEDEEILTFINKLKTENQLLIDTELTSNLPPSSLHSFRRILGDTPANGGLSELLLVDHGKEFTNQFYQSVLDDKRNVKFTYANVTIYNGTFLDTETMISRGYLSGSSSQVKISHLANAMAHALFHKVTGESYTGSHNASAHMVDELLRCYLETANCSLFVASEHGPTDGHAAPDLQTEPYPLYTGVRVWYNQAPYTTGMLLAFLTGAVSGTVKDECVNNDKEYSFHWMNGWNKTGVCVKSTVNFTEAVSPAFGIEGYDWTSGEYSTWTESVWRSLWARVFVSPSGRGARIAASLGALATLLVGLLTYWLHRHSDIVFAKQTIDIASINQDPSTAGILRTVNC